MSVTSVRTAQLLRSQSLEAQQTPQGEHSHNIVVAVDNSGDLKALQWACTLVKPGVVLHVVHVAKVISPQEEVFHGVVGTSLRFHESTLAETKEAINTVKAWWKRTIKASLDEKGIPFVAHFFVDTSNASSEIVASTIAKVAEEVDAQYIVVAKSNKTVFEKFTVGSVAAALARLTNRSLFLAV